MPENTHNLQSQYAQQVAADLERNAKEQDRIKTEAAALQDLLETLQKDHSLLVSVQTALGGESAEADAKKDSGPAVPKARRAHDDAPAGKGRRIKRTPKPTNGAKPAVPLRELVVGVLVERKSPSSAAEVAQELARTHPERSLNITLVRNALEASVARNQTERSKQQNSVYYSAIEKEAAKV